MDYTPGTVSRGELQQAVTDANQIRNSQADDAAAIDASFVQGTDGKRLMLADNQGSNRYNDLPSVKQLLSGSPTYGAEAKPYVPLFKDNFAGHVLSGLDDMAGLLVSPFREGPARGLFSNENLEGNRLMDAKMGLVFSAAGELTGFARGLKGFSAGETGSLNYSSRLTANAVSDDSFVRFDPTVFDASIDQLGIQAKFFNEGKVWLTKYGDIKNVTNPSDLETMLYRKNLWSSVDGKFSQGATLRVINNVSDATPAGVTNKTNGVRQWFTQQDIPPTNTETILKLKGTK